MPRSDVLPVSSIAHKGYISPTDYEITKGDRQMGFLSDRANEQQQLQAQEQLRQRQAAQEGLARQMAPQAGLSINAQLANLSPEQRQFAVQDLMGQTEANAQPMQPRYNEGLASRLAPNQGRVSMEEQLANLPPEQRAAAMQDLIGQNQAYSNPQMNRR